MGSAVGGREQAGRWKQISVAGSKLYTRGASAIINNNKIMRRQWRKGEESRVRVIGPLPLGKDIPLVKVQEKEEKNMTIKREFILPGLQAGEMKACITAVCLHVHR